MDLIFDSVSGRILFFVFVQDGFCFRRCFRTDFAFVIAWGRILFLTLLGDGFCVCHCFGTDPTSDWSGEKMFRGRRKVKA